MVELVAISSKTAKHSASGTMLAIIDVEEMKQLRNTMAHPGFHSGGFYKYLYETDASRISNN